MTVRSVLEALYFIAGVGIFAAACYAAKQVRLGSEQLKIASDQLKTTKEIADANSRRESIKLAAALCKYFADEVVPAQLLATTKYATEKCTFLTVNLQKPAFVLKDGDFAKVDYDINRIEPVWSKVGNELVIFLNKAESFAIPFAEGVADDGIGFQETAATFVATISVFMPVIYYLRMKQNVRYASVLKLWNIWHDRLAAKALTPEVMKLIQDLIDAGQKNIKPI
jgi:hypothetical protein